MTDIFPLQAGCPRVGANFLPLVGIFRSRGAWSAGSQRLCRRLIVKGQDFVEIFQERVGLRRSVELSSDSRQGLRKREMCRKLLPLSLHCRRCKPRWRRCDYTALRWKPNAPSAIGQSQVSRSGSKQRCANGRDELRLVRARRVSVCARHADAGWAPCARRPADWRSRPEGLVPTRYMQKAEREDRVSNWFLFERRDG